MKAKIVADSLAPNGVRLTTFEIKIPKFLQAELNTHRALSKNSASSRAIPAKKIRRMVVEDPVTFVSWGSNQAGMQAGGELSGWKLLVSKAIWSLARWPALLCHLLLEKLGLHKQVVNRVLEPWLHTVVLVSGTEWSNFFKLRCHASSQPEIRQVALDMRALYKTHSPKQVPTYAWHLPLCPDYDKLKFNYTQEQIRDIVSARCARISYLTHTGDRNPEADLALAARLRDQGHWSPFEHVAEASCNKLQPSGNFMGWCQHRKSVESSYQ